MNSNIVQYNVEEQEKWTKEMENSAGEYDMLINKLYSLIEEFVGSKEFSGGIATDLLNNFQSYKRQFSSYSETFREAAELMRGTTKRIINTEEEEKNMVKSNNPFGY